MFYMLMVVIGLNVIETDIYDKAEEFSARAQAAVAEHQGEISAMCLDRNGDKIMEAGRS
jgi:hypothetical protein